MYSIARSAGINSCQPGGLRLNLTGATVGIVRTLRDPFPKASSLSKSIHAPPCQGRLAWI